MTKLTRFHTTTRPDGEALGASINNPNDMNNKTKMKIKINININRWGIQLYKIQDTRYRIHGDGKIAY